MTVSTEKLKNSFLSVWGILILITLFFSLRYAGTNASAEKERPSESTPVTEAETGTAEITKPETICDTVIETEALYVFAENSKLSAKEVNGVLCLPLGELFLSCGASTDTVPEIEYDSELGILLLGERAIYAEGIFCDDGEIYIPDNLAISLFGATYDCGVIYGTELPNTHESYYNSEDLYWLSAIISAEARGECFEGKLAVGSVVLNRTESDFYPDDVKGVIFDTVGGVQFTPAASGSIYKEPTEESVLAAKVCLEGYRLDRSILFFYNPSISTSTYFTEKRTFVTSIGNHDFFS